MNIKFDKILGKLRESDLPSYISDFDEGTGFEDSTYLYVVFGEDEDWIVDRFLRTDMTKTTTGNQTGDKPTTLAELQALIYN